MTRAARWALLLLLAAAPPRAWADPALIREMESLLGGLPLDDAARPRMALRLAGLHFEAAREAERRLHLKGEDAGGEARGHGRRAVRLYEEALSGHGGVFEAPKGETALKIHFQLARLHHRAGAAGRAQAHYKKALASPLPTLSDVRRESHLGLAEIHEERGETEKAGARYTEALGLCREGAACSYIRYRRAWTHYNGGRIDEAVDDMGRALFDVDGSVRERSLQDYTLFLSARPTDGTREIALMEGLQERTGRGGLLRGLMEAWSEAGNRRAALNALRVLAAREPNLADLARVAEETYGFRDWGGLAGALDRLEGAGGAPAGGGADDARKSLERLIVQLDAEREARRPEAAGPLMRAVTVFLALFPEDGNRHKMMRGWLAAAPDDGAELARLGEWAAEEEARGEAAMALELRTARLALAERLGDDGAFLEESRVLAERHRAASPGSEEARRLAYAHAYKLYETGDHDRALPIFGELALPGEDAPDEWAVRSQNLALDVLSKRRDYDGIVARADAWLARAGAWKGDRVAKELEDMRGIRERAAFERAAALGETPEALAAFRGFCRRGAFAEKACGNARVLAVALGDQAALVEVLGLQGDEESLLAELELMGEFGRAAPLYERLVLAKSPTVEHHVKAALLRELALDTEGRDRHVRALARLVRRRGEMPEGLEPVLHRMMDESGLLGAGALGLPWSDGVRLRLAGRLESAGLGNAETRRILTSPKETTGPHWARFHLERVGSLAAAQSKIGFHGRGSRRRFQRRLAALDRFRTEAVAVVEGATDPTRAIALEMLRRAYAGLAQEIGASPVPDGLDEAARLDVARRLEEMAAPFREEEASYGALKAAALGRMDGGEARALEARLAEAASGLHLLVPEAPPPRGPARPALPAREYRARLAALRERPSDAGLLEDVRRLLLENGRERMAAYFTGRIQELGRPAGGEQL